jgi:hypothetical protein
MDEDYNEVSSLDILILLRYTSKGFKMMGTCESSKVFISQFTLKSSVLQETEEEKKKI